MVRTFVKDIREAGRNTQGVKLIDLGEGDKLQAIAPVISEQQEDAAGRGGGGVTADNCRLNQQVGVAGDACAGFHPARS